MLQKESKVCPILQAGVCNNIFNNLPLLCESPWEGGSTEVVTDLSGTL